MSFINVNQAAQAESFTGTEPTDGSDSHTHDNDFLKRRVKVLETVLGFTSNRARNLEKRVEALEKRVQALEKSKDFYQNKKRRTSAKY